MINRAVTYDKCSTVYVTHFAITETQHSSFPCSPFPPLSPYAKGGPTTPSTTLLLCCWSSANVLPLSGAIKILSLPLSCNCRGTVQSWQLLSFCDNKVPYECRTDIGRGKPEQLFCARVSGTWWVTCKRCMEVHEVKELIKIVLVQVKLVFYTVQIQNTYLKLSYNYRYWIDCQKQDLVHFNSCKLT